MHTTSPAADSRVGIADLVKILQHSRASKYRDIKSNTFLKPLKLGSFSRRRLSDLKAQIGRLSDERVKD